MNWLRRVGLSLLVLGISTAIFVLMISDKETKKEILRPTLEALGTQLFAAVREDSQKGELEKNYQIFVTQAEAQEIPAEKVERVAAQILNLGNKDSLISSTEALAFLMAETPTRVMRIDSLERGTVAVAPAPPAKRSAIAFKAPPKVYKVSADELAIRLRDLHSFQREMKRLAQAPEKRHLIRQRYYFFPTDSGLTVHVDAALREDLPENDADLARKFAELEKKRWLKWDEQQRQLEGRHFMNEDSLQRVMEQVAKISVMTEKFGKAFVDSIKRQAEREHGLEHAQRPHREIPPPPEMPR